MSKTKKEYEILLEGEGTVDGAMVVTKEEHDAFYGSERLNSISNSPYINLSEFNELHRLKETNRNVEALLRQFTRTIREYL